MPVEELAQPTAAHEHLQTDPTMAELVTQHGYLGVEPAADPFTRLLKSIVRQQVSMAAAEATWERLTTEFEVTPAAMLATEPTALQAVGLSEAKSEYVRNVARAFQDRGWSRSTFEGLDDRAVMDSLTEIRGIGAWTAKMFLLFGLGRPDVFPVEDLGVRRAMTELYGDETRDSMAERATTWAPYRSIGSLYLWRAQD
ncbi:MAG: DNA-3-methyladenine glycosylase family protein [Halobacteriota archaeon]